MSEEPLDIVLDDDPSGVDTSSNNTSSNNQSGVSTLVYPDIQSGHSFTKVLLICPINIQELKFVQIAK